MLDTSFLLQCNFHSLATIRLSEGDCSIPEIRRRIFRSNNRCSRYRKATGISSTYRRCISDIFRYTSIVAVSTLTLVDVIVKLLLSPFDEKLKNVGLTLKLYSYVITPAF